MSRFETPQQPSETLPYRNLDSSPDSYHLVPPVALSDTELRAFTRKTRPVTVSECLWFALKYALELFLLYVAASLFFGGAR